MQRTQQPGVRSDRPRATVAISNAVFTAALALVFLKEVLSPQQWACIGAVILGMVLLKV